METGKGLSRRLSDTPDISPGWVGGRWVGSRRSTSRAPLVVVRDFDLIGISLLPQKTAMLRRLHSRSIFLSISPWIGAIMAKAKDVTFLSAALLAASLLTARVSAAQVTPPSTGPGVGDVAPSFSLPGATRYGLLRDPVNLAHYRGKVVVLAFFFKARTKG
jgi:hypothetical protein